MANYVQPGVYRIVNAQSDTAIDLSAGDNKSIIGWPQNGGPNQLWRVSEIDGSENQFIESVGRPGTYLTLTPGGSFTDATHLEGTQGQFRWALRRDEKHGDRWRIYVPNTCHNVDLSDNGNANGGTIVQIWEKWDGMNQLWRFEKEY